MIDLKPCPFCNDAAEMINIYMQDVSAKIEEETLGVIKKMGVDVNKEELIKALNYDRQQYEKGYEDGKKDADRSAPKTYKEWVELECKFCRSHERGDTLYESADWDCGIGFDYIRDIKFCPLCGRELFYESNEEGEIV